MRVYDRIYQRYQLEGQVNLPAPPGAPPAALQFSPPTIDDVVLAQQFLTTSIATYITNLGAMWQAVVDVTDLIQTNDMFHMGQDKLPTEPVPVLPDLEQLKSLMPTHPCSPLPDRRLRGGDGTWPPAIPTKDNSSMPPADRESRKAQPAETVVVKTPTPQPAPAPAQPSKPAPNAGLAETQPAIDPRLLEPPPPLTSRQSP